MKSGRYIHSGNEPVSGFVTDEKALAPSAVGFFCAAGWQFKRIENDELQRIYISNK